MGGAEWLESDAELSDDFFDNSLSSDVFLLDGLLDYTFVCFPVSSIVVFASFVMTMLSQIRRSDPGLLSNELEQLKEIILVKLTIVTLLYFG